ncbi:MAG: bifunctional riboflavin kinase/FAD synthetase [Burkholderiaceae bacterium]|jgi:riboflavin kinase/FMN adenylyltransferase|nr:MAG: bifunctional riboflavin kinase/FAD synthetase [Burkholderiaceae bacterium]
MKIFRGLRHPNLASACALTVGNFDGVHRGHQAMLALLKSEAAHRGIPSCVMTFEPHPRDYFAALRRQPDLAPARIATLRDKLAELARCGIAQAVVLPFNTQLARRSPDNFIDEILVQGLGVRYVLVGDDFRFGAQRAGDYALLDRAGARLGFDVARMDSYEVHGARVSSSAVRAALADGRMDDAAALLGRRYTISGHVVRGRELGRQLGESKRGAADGFRTLNLRFSRRAHAWKPAASGIFVVRVLGLTPQPLDGVANLGVRPSLDPNDINGGRVLLETYVLDWPQALGPEGGYGKIIQVELLHKLHDERRYPDLADLTAGMQRDCADARAWLAARAARI